MRSQLAIALAAIAALALTGWVIAGPQPVFEDVVISPAAAPFDGEVLPMAEILKAKGLAHDEDDAAATSVAFVDKQGKVYSLLKTPASRMLFVDSRLHDVEPVPAEGSSLIHHSEQVTVNRKVPIENRKPDGDSPSGFQGFHCKFRGECVQNACFPLATAACWIAVSFSDSRCLMTGF